MKTAATKIRPESSTKASANCIGCHRAKRADNLHPLAGIIDSSHQVQQHAGLQNQIDKSSYATAQLKQQSYLFGTKTLQRQEDEELMQGKFETVQRQEDEKLMQGKFETAAHQLQEDEELLQGKFGPIQRQEDEELMQGKFQTVQRQEDEELLQGKFTTLASVQLKEGPELQSNKTGMSDQLKSGLENLSGMDMSDVRVHYNSPKPAQLSALAYTQGTDIHVAPGQERHLPHEGWHAVQQKQGRVQPTIQMEGTPVNNNSGLEKEADVMGGKALQMKDGICQQGRPENHRFAKAIEKNKDNTRQEPRADLTPFPNVQKGTMSQLQSTIKEHNTKICQFKTTWAYKHNRRHYTDGWGDLYSIISDRDLRNKVNGDGRTGNNNKRRINLGTKRHLDEGVRKWCSILYSWYQPFGGANILKTVKHCGPSGRNL